MTKTELIEQIDESLGEAVTGNRKTHVQIQRVMNKFKQAVEQENQPNTEEN